MEILPDVFLGIAALCSYFILFYGSKMNLRYIDQKGVGNIYFPFGFRIWFPKVAPKKPYQGFQWN